MKAWGRRYQPYVLALVAIVALIVLPGESDDHESRQTDAGQAAPPSAPAPDAGGGAAPTASPAGEGNRPPARAANAGAAAAAAAPRYPGVGTPDALANPNCDAARGKNKFPSLWSAPCVIAFPKGANNGGATAPGITADTIRIVVRLNPGASQDDDAATKKQILDSWEIWSAHHELWGRKLDIKFFKATGEDEVAQRADATQAYNELKPFMAVSMYNLTGGSPYIWSTELAARGVIVWDPDAFWADTQGQAGYRWTHNEDDAIHALLVGEWVGKRISGHPARWAGDLAYRAQRRVLGLIHPDKWQKAMFDREATKYNVTLADDVPYPQGFDVANAQERARTQVARMKERGVNSVILVADPIVTILITREATQQRYFPEWVNTGWFIQDLNLLTRVYDQQQAAHMFGIGFIPPLPPPEKEERYQLHVWQHGRPPDDTAAHGTVYLFARDIVPALQLAGPTLSPQTFRAAIFAKPPAGGAWTGGVTSTGTSYGRWDGRGWDDYSGWDAYNEMWWDPNQPGTDEVGLTAPGMYWRLNGGKQYTYGQVPAGEPRMFDRRDAVYKYDEVPPADRVPSYPRS